ncbi:hypothetical protein [Salinisphaera orenii]|nr:hypothetical protein [Salinisphaera halophila]
MNVTFVGTSDSSKQLHLLMEKEAFPFLDQLLETHANAGAGEGIALYHSVAATCIAMPLWKIERITSEQAQSFTHDCAQCFVGQIGRIKDLGPYSPGPTSNGFENALNKYFDLSDEVLEVVAPAVDVALASGSMQKIGTHLIQAPFGYTRLAKSFSDADVNEFKGKLSMLGLNLASMSIKAFGSA